MRELKAGMTCPFMSGPCSMDHCAAFEWMCGNDGSVCYKGCEEDMGEECSDKYGECRLIKPVVEMELILP